MTTTRASGPRLRGHVARPLALLLASAISSLAGGALAADPTPAPPRTRAGDEPGVRSPAMVGIGIALTALGALSTTTGGALLAAGVACAPGGPCDMDEDMRHGVLAGGIGSAVFGAVAMGIGVPLWVVGAQRTAPQSAASAQLRLDGRGAAVRVSF